VGQEGLKRRNTTQNGAGCGRRDGDAKLFMGAGVESMSGEAFLGRAIRLLMFPAVLALGACGMPLPDFESFRAPTSDMLFRPMSVTSYREKALPPVSPDDLVDASGRCAGAFVPAATSGDPNAPQAGVPLPDAGVPMIPSAVSLDMSECDVVKRAGIAQRVEIGRGDRGERKVTMTYLSGDRAGVYTFSDGRLKSMERGPDQPPEPKVAKKGKPAKKPKPQQRTAIQVQ
jgi:hypothetical protein